MSTSAAVIDYDDREHFSDALEKLRRARRRNRIANIDKFDAFYKAYLIAVFGSLALYGLAGNVGDAPVTGATLATVKAQGPSYVAALVAVLVAVGLRSGGRGGPLAFEQADVRHVLLSPVDRRDSIRRPALRQLRHGAFLGAAVGAALGIVALRRLPGLPVAWIACGALFGALVVVAGYAVAMVASGHRLPRPLCDVLAAGSLGWAAFDAVNSVRTSPFSWVGTVALWPAEFDPLGLAGVAVVLCLAAGGIWSVNACSIEAAERRSRLVGQLRFAATLQDVRTVMVIHRQLSQENIRVRPWIRLPQPRRFLNSKGNPRLGVFVRRSLHGWFRWPLFRILRLFALTTLAGFAVCGVWTGNTFLVVPAGLCLWLMALDLLEPLAQETDHPDRMEMVGRQIGWIKGRHVIAPLVATLGLVGIGSIPAVVLGPPEIVTPLLLPMIMCVTLLSVGGAALVVAGTAKPPTGNIVSAEVAGISAMLKLVLPPGLAIGGLVPLIFARDAWVRTESVEQMLVAVNLPWYGALVGGTWAVAWVRYGDELRESLGKAGARSISGEENVKK